MKTITRPAAIIGLLLDSSSDRSILLHKELSIITENNVTLHIQNVFDVVIILFPLYQSKTLMLLLFRHAWDFFQASEAVIKQIVPSLDGRILSLWQLLPMLK